MIDVQVIDGVGFVWKVDDIQTLREKFRIVGSLIGFTARTPEIGLPLTLSQEEMQLLKEKEIIRLFEVSLWRKDPSISVIERVQEFREKSYQSQIDEFKEERRQVIIKMSDKIVEGKQRKMIEMLNSKRKCDGVTSKSVKKMKVSDEDKTLDYSKVVDLSSDDDIEEAGIVVNIDKEQVINQEIAKIKPITRDMQAVQTFADDPWLDEKDRVDSSWIFPYSDHIRRCKLFTFKDLWNHNYFVTDGSKFGGDFLVYPGDPLLCHAKYIVNCVSDQEDVENRHRLQDVVSRSRLGTCVKKIILFSWLQGDDVKYRSVRRGQDLRVKEENQDS